MNATTQDEGASKPTTPAPAPAENNGKRTAMLAALAGGTLLAAVAYGAYYFTVARYYEGTDDAYVNGNLVQLNSQIVNTGGNVIKLDPADTRIDLSRSEAALAQAVQQVSTLYVNNSVFKAQIAQRQAELARADDDLKRRLSADQSGAVSAEDIAHARDAVKERKAALETAQQQLNANRAQTVA